MPGWLRGPSLALASILCTAVVLEVLLRAWYGGIGPLKRSEEERRRWFTASYPLVIEPHPDRIFELRPGAEHIQESWGEFGKATFRISSQRLRDVEHSQAKPPGTYRILALGDSFTFGWAVDVDETWWARLAAGLEAEAGGRTIEVINLGVHSYAVDQQVQRLEDIGLAYEPDLIVADFWPHYALVMTTHEYQVQSDKPWPKITDSSYHVDRDGIMYLGQPVPLEPVRRRSALIDFVFHRARLIQARSDASSQLRRNDLDIFDEAQADEPIIREGWLRTKAGYAHLAAVAAARNIPLLVFVIPTDLQVWPAWKAKGDGSAPPALLSDLPQRIFLRSCGELQLACLDLLPAFREAAARDPSTPLFFRTDPHWSPAGHRLAARLLEQHLGKLGWPIIPAQRRGATSVHPRPA